jgi:hypothetical protein
MTTIDRLLDELQKLASTRSHSSQELLLSLRAGWD